MIQNKTRIKITWFTAIMLPLLVAYAVYSKMNDVASAGIGAYGLIIGGYIAGKTWNNKSKIENHETKN